MQNNEKKWLIYGLEEIKDEIGNYPFAPCGSLIDPDSPNLGFTINKKIDVWADNLDELYEKAKSEQWNASKDIPWESMKKLPDDIESAVSQLMTFIAQNEYIALYLPTKFLWRINPYYDQVIKYLSTQVYDEARHVEVFTKRALLGKGLGYVTSSTQHALKSLLDIDDYKKAKFLLNILGEGTFDDLFTYLINFSPDEVTRQIFVLAKRDESRHVAYGVSRTRYQLRKDPSLRHEFLRAIEERASYMFAVSGADPYVIRSIAVLAGGGSDYKHVEEGMNKIKEMHESFDKTRVARLMLAGFDKDTAQRISSLHGEAIRSYM